LMLRTLLVVLDVVRMGRIESKFCCLG
jgi:hypothetical protein